MFFFSADEYDKKNIKSQSESIKLYRAGHRTAVHPYNKQSIIMRWCGQ